MAMFTGKRTSKIFLFHKYSKVPVIRTGTYASSAVHTMY